jgi:hypothetical protein
MTYGKTGVLRGRRHRDLVLFQRPLAAAFPRQAQGAMGNSAPFSRVLNERNIPCSVAEGQRNPANRHEAPGGKVAAHRAEILEEWERKVQPQ